MDVASRFSPLFSKQQTDAFTLLVQAMDAGRLQPDDKILMADGTCSAVKCAIEPVWYLPGIAKRFKLDESTLREVGYTLDVASASIRTVYLHRNFTTAPCLSLQHKIASSCNFHFWQLHTLASRFLCLLTPISSWCN